MNVILIVVQIVASIGLVGLILMQQGKGAEAGASFGAGASQTFFGSAGSASAVTKLTALFATIFFAASLGLAYVAQEDERSGLQKELSEQLAPSIPAAADSANTGLAPVAAESTDAVNEGLSPKPVSEAVESMDEAMEKAAVETEAAIDSAVEALDVIKSENVANDAATTESAE